MFGGEPQHHMGRLAQGAEAFGQHRANGRGRLPVDQPGAELAGGGERQIDRLLLQCRPVGVEGGQERARRGDQHGGLFRQTLGGAHLGALPAFEAAGGKPRLAAARLGSRLFGQMQFEIDRRPLGHDFDRLRRHGRRGEVLVEQEAGWGCHAGFPVLSRSVRRRPWTW
nr:hypothetical protein [Prosthecodimorpha staleyi]